MPKYFYFFLLSTLCQSAWAQVLPSTGEEIIESFSERQKKAEASLLRNYAARSIGPVVQGGRVSDLAVSGKSSTVYYVAYASGGIFKTTNNGITFTPIFDGQGALGIGDMALAPSNEQVIYVGTGENNSSRSSYAGSGIYKSVDEGATWTYAGLPNIQHTGRMVVHPQNPDIVWVAATGSLYSHGPDRGVYKSTDGGLNWTKTLFVNDSTGIIDLMVNPRNPDQLWATSWERTRKAWDFKGHGPGSGVYRSDDGGTTWKKLVNGLPDHEFMGRIGIDLCLEQPNIIYALLDNQQESQAPKKIEDGELQAKDFLEMTRSDFMKLDSAALNKYLRNNGFPQKYQAEQVMEKVKKGEFEPKALADYLGDANRDLFDTKVTGAELYRSDDFGDSWKKVNSYELEGVYHTYGYYFGEVRVAPDNPEEVYIFGVPLLTSKNGGSTFHRLDTIGDVHVDHQALWINHENTKHLLLGNDGGLYVSYDGGGNWLHLNNTAVGQFYTVNVDFEKPYSVYGGLQDNGVLKGSSRSIPNKTEHWERVFGGDGMFVAADPRNSQLIYTGFQFGNYFRINKANGERKRITPKHDIGENVLRFNWRTPLILSEHNADIVYLGAQKLFRSLDKGDTWEAISDDLTKNLPQGNVPYSTITCISESPLKFGLIYLGTDDGNIQVTRGGGDWELVSKELPQRWISSIFPSPHAASRVYISMNGYRDDEFKTYVYYSDNYGKDWLSLKGDLPDVAINVIKQDALNSDLLYLGSDHGLYVSFDHGVKWQFVTAIPNVAVYDLMVHPRENELVVATHGRSIFIMDVKPWQKLSKDQLDQEVVLFETDAVTYSKSWGEAQYAWQQPDVPTKKFLYYVGQSAADIKVSIKDPQGKVIRSLTAEGSTGFHYLTWDLKSIIKKRKETLENYVLPGQYTLSFISGDLTKSIQLNIKDNKR